MPLKLRAGAAARRPLVLMLLMLVYTCNSADRSLIPIIGQAMKADLKLSDTQLGLLAGTAFAALYALSGIPIARLAERFSRVNILAAAVALWSTLTDAVRAQRLVRAADRGAHRRGHRRGGLFALRALAHLGLLRPQPAHHRAVGVLLRPVAGLPVRVDGGRLRDAARRLAQRVLSSWGCPGSRSRSC